MHRKPARGSDKSFNVPMTVRKAWDTPGGGPTTSPDGMPMGESNKFVYDGVPGTHQWVRWHTASVGIQARLAP